MQAMNHVRDASHRERATAASYRLLDSEGFKHE